MDCSVCVVASLRLGLANYIIRDVVVLFKDEEGEEEMGRGDEQSVFNSI